MTFFLLENNRFKQRLPQIQLVFLFILTLLFALTTPINPIVWADSSLNDHILYNALQGQGETVQNNLTLIQTDSKKRQNIAPGLKNTSAPFIWSKDGKKLVFVNNYSEVYVINSDGTELTQVLSSECFKVPEFQFAWLPNSQQLAITEECMGATSDVPGSISLYLSDASGEAGTQLIKQWQDELSSRLYFSSDGRQVAFVQNQDIYRMNTEGSQLKNLTQNPDIYSSGGSPLRWSPNGQHIAFYLGNYPQQQVYVIDAEGQNLTNLTNNPNHQVYNVELVWSPDSNQIAYYHNNSSSGGGNQQDIYLVNLQDKSPTSLTRNPAEYQELSWSPDGEYLAFTMGEFSNRKLYTIDIETSRLNPISPNLKIMGSAFLSWSPDSQHLAFTVEETVNNQNLPANLLYIVRYDGSELTQLTDSSESVFFPTWQPKSHNIQSIQH